MGAWMGPNEVHGCAVTAEILHEAVVCQEGEDMNNLGASTDNVVTVGLTEAQHGPGLVLLPQDEKGKRKLFKLLKAVQQKE